MRSPSPRAVSGPLPRADSHLVVNSGSMSRSWRVRGGHSARARPFLRGAQKGPHRSLFQPPRPPSSPCPRRGNCRRDASASARGDEERSPRPVNPRVCIVGFERFRHQRTRAARGRGSGFHGSRAPAQLLIAPWISEGHARPGGRGRPCLRALQLLFPWWGNGAAESLAVSL